MFLKFLQISQETPLLEESLFNIVAGLKTCNFIKRDSNAGIFWWNLQNFKNTFFYGTPLVAGKSLWFIWQGIFWSFSISLPWLYNIMLNLLTESFFDISLLFKLKYGNISLILWTVNKSCYETHVMFTQIHKIDWFKKKVTFVCSEKVEMISTF